MSGATLPDKVARATALTDIDRSFLVEAGAGSGKTSIMAGPGCRPSQNWINVGMALSTAPSWLASSRLP
jgi:hypothetical protein